MLISSADTSHMAKLNNTTPFPMTCVGEWISDDNFEHIQT